MLSASATYTCTTRGVVCAVASDAAIIAAARRSTCRTMLFTGLRSLASILLHRLVELFHPAFALKHFARTRPIRRAHNAILLHQINQVRRAAIPNPQSPLQCGSRSAPHLAADPHRILIKLVVGFFSAAIRRALKSFFHFSVVIFRRFQQLFVVLCLRLLPPEIAH